MDKKELTNPKRRPKPKKEVEDSLKELGIYTKVMRYIKTVGWKHLPEYRQIYQLRKAETAHHPSWFIRAAFEFTRTKEGLIAWSETTLLIDRCECFKNYMPIKDRRILIKKVLKLKYMPNEENGCASTGRYPQWN